MYRRYGEFRFRDYISVWFAISLLLVLMVVCVLTKIQVYWLIWPLFFILIMGWSIYKPNSECFLIFSDTITVVQGRQKRNITIPSEATIILSYADVCPPLAKRIGYGNQTYMLKGRYSISILQKIPLETVFNRLHQNHAYKYTNSTVEACFDEYLYVYSFVGNQEILDKLVANRNYQIIVPETLVHQISIDLHQINVHVDAGI